MANGATMASFTSKMQCWDSIARVLCRGNSVGAEHTKNDTACEACAVKFTVFKRKRQCMVCERFFCSQCLPVQNGNGNGSGSAKVTAMLSHFTERRLKCSKCKVLTARPLSRPQLLQLRAKDLQLYLSSQNVSTRGCVEKDDLVNLLIRHVGSSTNSRTSRSDETTPRPNCYQSGAFCSSPSSSSSVTRPAPPSEPSNATFPETVRPHSTGDVFATTSHETCPSAPPEEVHSFSSPSHHPRNPSDSSPTTSPCTEDVPVPTVDSPGSTERHNVAQNTTFDISELIDWPDDSSDEELIPVVTDVEDISLPPVLTEETEASGEETETPTHQAYSRITLESITDAAELDLLTVKQLKELLVLNRVDFRGCCEKAELKERVRRLWQENTQARKELENLTMDELCKICMDAPVECVMLECGHMATCTACGKQLSECPICRQYVVRVVRTFRS